MKSSQRKTCSAGFTLIEALVVITVMALVTLFGLPTMMSTIHRNRIEGVAQRTAIMMRAARFESIRRGVTTLVYIDGATGEIVAFADLDGVNATDPPDGLFNPVAGEPRLNTDYEIGRVRLPNGLGFTPPGGQQAVDGFTTVPGVVPNRLVFRANGSAEDGGAFRIGDERGNYLEARVDPPATARVEMRKWDGSAWHAPGQGGGPWEWN